MGGRKEKRLRPRLNLYLFMRVRRKGSAETDAGDETFTVNISSVGVYFLSRREYTPGTQIEMHITVPSYAHFHSDASTYLCEAEVVRCEIFVKNGGSSDEWAYGIAAKFLRGFRLAILEEV